MGNIHRNTLNNTETIPDLSPLAWVREVTQTTDSNYIMPASQLSETILGEWMKQVLVNGEDWVAFVFDKDEDVDDYMAQEAFTKAPAVCVGDIVGSCGEWGPLYIVTEEGTLFRLPEDRNRVPYVPISFTKNLSDPEEFFYYTPVTHIEVLDGQGKTKVMACRRRSHSS